MSSEKRLAEKSVIFTISKIAASGSIIGLFVLLSHLLSTVEYGTFRQVWMVNKNLMEVFSFGVPISIFYLLPRLANGRKKLFVIQSIILLSLFGILFSCIIFLFARQVALLFSNPELEYFLRLFCLYPLFVLPTLAVQSVLVSLDKAIQLAVFTIANRILMLIVAVTLVLLHRSLGELFVGLLAFAFCELVASIYFVFHFMKGFGMLSKKFDFGKQLKFAFPSGAANVVGIVNQELDKFIIASYFSVAQFARYANGAFEIPFVGTIASSVTSVLMPEYVKRFQMGDYKSLLSLWHRAICKVAMVLMPVMVILFGLAPEFIITVFSSKYQESSLIFRIYLISLVPKITWYAPILVSMGYNREPLYGSAVSLGSNAVLNYILIQWVGFTGPAIATVVATYLVTYYYLHRIRDILQVSWFDVFPWTNLMKTLLASIVAYVVLLPLSFFHDLSNIIRLTVGGTAYMICVYYAFRFLKLMSKEDVEFINGYIFRMRNAMARVI